MPLPALVASDFDGTLTDPRGRVTARTARALARLGELGVPVVVATGRCLGALPELLSLLPVRTPVVAGNGALIVDPVTRKVLDERLIPPGVLAEQTVRIRDTLPGVVFGAESGEEFLHEPDYPVPRDPVRPERRACWSELVAAPVAKLVARWPVTPAPEHSARVAGIVGDSLTAVFSGAPGLVEIMAPGVTKAAGVSRLAHLWGIAARDVTAFGDMPNDLPMLRWAGHGVAVAWAHPRVLGAVGARTPAAAAGGVGAYLEQMMGSEPRQAAV